MAKAPSIENATADQVRLALEKAAFRDTFIPDEILEISRSDHSWTNAIRRLAEFCVEVETPYGLRWSLQPDARANTLRSLSTSRLRTLAIDAENSRDDSLGCWLATVILDKDVNLDTLPPTSIQLLRKAALYVESSALASTLHAINRRIERLDADASVQLARSGKVFGRHWQLRRLRGFVEQKGSSLRPVKSFEVTGPGGSGKSALLAEFVWKMRGKSWDGSPVVWIDFDRKEMASANPLVLTMELSRQIGIAKPEWADSMNTFRRLASESSVGKSSERALDFHSSSIELKVLSSLWRRCIDGIQLRSPIILILDTFEEIAIQTDEVARRLDRWLLALVSEFELDDLRVVKSGRTMPRHDQGSDFESVQAMAIGDLPKSDARRLLQNLIEREQRHGRASIPYDLLLERYGRNPLVLKLLAGWINQDPHFALSDLTSSDTSTRIPNAIVQGVLYRRILGRMRTDENVKKLASPGLILRRVTPSIIQHVLAEPCGLGVVSSRLARQMFETLGSQVWLVHREPKSGALVHRKDLRQLMLSLLTEDGSKTADIHARAIRYYDSGIDGDLPERQRELEVRYHQLMLGELGTLEPGEAKALLQSIGTDITCAPAAAVARLKAQADYRLTSDELTQLDPDLRVIYERRTASRLSRESRAIPLAEAIKVTNLSGLIYTQPIEYNVVLDLFTQARFSEISAIADRLFERAFKERIGGIRVLEGRNLTESSLWKAALSALVTGSASSLKSSILMNMATYRHEANLYERFNVEGEAKLTFKDGIETILNLLSPEPIEFSWTGPTKSFLSRIKTIDEYRQAQLCPNIHKHFFKEGNELRAGLVRFLTHETLRYLELTEEIQRSKNIRRLPILAQSEGMFESGTFDLGFVQELVEQPIVLTEYDASAGTRQALFASGMMSDLYPAICPALEIINPDVVCKFVESLPHGRRKLWPIELQAHRLRPALVRDRVGWTAALVECADRHGLLLKLLRYCQNDNRQALSSVCNLVQAVEKQIASRH
ncbi:hypothetical protein GTP41_20765 [Pseudoduganella sp. DS3]|uniref:Uncharacterized protein n=1 Tax=Pseudoduganella guangdongensis TaxID=2692179 RepID=A0A6N9HLJ7_9BURK|nr:ATP-binding protein [Pseudoduganella guangdongensis]MYN04528.1 hypothetical protein [Pseudoduganella guangdongensis]